MQRFYTQKLEVLHLLHLFLHTAVIWKIKAQVMERCDLSPLACPSPCVREGQEGRPADAWPLAVEDVDLAGTAAAGLSLS